MFSRLLAGTALVAAAVLAPVHAAQIVIDATDAEFTDRHGSSTGLFVSDIFTGDLGAVGADEFSGEPNFSVAETRYALQFDLAALPTNATITQATLRLRDVTGADDIFVYGFAGNGVFSAASVTTGSQLFQAASNASPDSYDVSTFVEALSTGVEAGFSIRQSPVSDSVTTGFFETSQDQYVPQLTIAYTVPTPASTVPEPVSLSLFGVGMLGMGLSRRRKHG
jgi:hypothetical protein